MQGRRVPNRRTSFLFIVALMLPAVLLVAALRLIPLIRAFLLAFPSPSVTWGGTRGLLHESLAQWAATVAANGMGLLLVAAIGMAIATELCERGGLRPLSSRVVAVLLLFPLFIPESVLANVLISIPGLVGVSTRESSAYARVSLIAVEVLRYAGLAGCIGTIAAVSGPSRLKRRYGVGLVILVRSAFLPVENLDTLSIVSRTLHDPVVPAPFQSIWLVPEFSIEILAASSRVWLIHFSLRLCLIAACIFVARRTGIAAWWTGRAAIPETSLAYPRLEAISGRRYYASMRTVLRFAMWGWTAVVTGVLAVLVFRPILTSHDAIAGFRVLLQSHEIGSAMVQFAVVACASAAVGTFVAVAVSYLVWRLSIHGRTIILMILVFILAISRPGIHDYLVLRDYTLLNSLYLFFLRGLLPALPVLVLIAAKPFNVLPFRASNIDRLAADNVTERSSSELFRFVFEFVQPRKTLILTTVVFHIVWNWNTVGIESVFMIRESALQSPVSVYHTVVMADAAFKAGVGLLGALISLPPATIFAVFWRRISIYFGRSPTRLEPQSG